MALLITFSVYATVLAKINMPTILVTLVTHYIRNSLTAGNLPCAKKPMVIDLTTLVRVFPGILSFLPPPPDGATEYPDDYKYVVWLASPQSKNDPQLYAGSFMPMCKPYDDWRSFALADGAKSGARIDTTSAHLWCPVPFVNAMLNDPVKVMGMPESTSKAVASMRLAQALRKSPWIVKRFVLLVPMYTFLQTHVVEPAFKHIASTNIKAAVGSDYSSIVPIPKVSEETVDTTDRIAAYHAFAANPRESGTYAPLMRALCGAVDRFPGYQAHSYGEDNRPRFDEVIPTASPSDPGSLRTRTSPTARGLPPSAGSSARTVVSPGNPGTSKTPRYVDAARGRVVPTALFNTPGAPQPRAQPPAAPAPGSAHVGALAAPATPGYPGFPAVPGYPPMAPGSYPMAPGGYPMPYGFPGFPYPGYPPAAQPPHHPQ